MDEPIFQEHFPCLIALDGAPYPLQIDTAQAQAMLACADAIMDAVPENRHAEVRDFYNLLTRSLWHPVEP